MLIRDVPTDKLRRMIEATESLLGADSVPVRLLRAELIQRVRQTTRKSEIALIAGEIPEVRPCP